MAVARQNSLQLKEEMVKEAEAQLEKVGDPEKETKVERVSHRRPHKLNNIEL